MAKASKTPAKKLPGSPLSPHWRARLWVTTEKTYLGKGRIGLLEAIDQTGSISQAAKSMQLSYRKAWQLVEEMNQLCPQPLVIRHTGGKGGGGAEVTPLGKAFVTYYYKAQAEVAQTLNRLEDEMENLLKQGQL